MTSHLRLDGSHDSGFSSAHNMYPSQRISQYDSSDQLVTPQAPNILPINQNNPCPSPQPFQPMVEDPQRNSTRQLPTSLNYGSLDRNRRNFQQDAYRDVSPSRHPARSGNKSPGVDQLFRAYADDRSGFDSPVRGAEKNLGDTGRGYVRDTVSPTKIMLEVPVHHERGHSLPAPSSPRQGWKDPSQEQYNPSGYPQSPVTPTGSFVPEHCYSPRMYEGKTQRPYHDVDSSHIHRGHPANLPDTSKTSTLGYHSSSQPVFHRTERSMSPMGPPNHMPPRPQEFEHVSASPLPFRQYQSPHSSHPSSPHDLPRSIPIHHVDSIGSSHRPTSPQYPTSPLASHPPSSPSSPLPTPSSLVTVTRLQPHTEVSKPYEFSDYVKYSERLRRKRQVEQVQQQLFGDDHLPINSGSISPQSVDSDGHSSHSSSQHSSHSYSSPHSFPHSPHPSNHLSSHSSSSMTSPTSPQPQGLPPSSASSLKPPRAMQHYGRSASAPLASPSFPPKHYDSSAPYPDGQISSGSSYTMKSAGGHTHYAMHQTYKVQHSSAKHSHYQPPQPMTCNPVRNPTYGDGAPQPR